MPACPWHLIYRCLCTLCAAGAPSAARPPRHPEDRQHAWQDAWQEAGDAPVVAASFSVAFPSLLLAHRAHEEALPGAQPSLLPSQLELQPEQEQEIVKAEVRCGPRVWGLEALHVLVLAVPLAVSVPSAVQ